MAPGLQDAEVLELIAGLPLGPRLVVEQRHQRVLLRELSSHELSEAGWEGQRGDEQCHQRGEQQALLHQEAVDGLLAAHELHDLAVEVDEERAPKATGDPDDGEGGQLLQVEGEVEAESGFEERCDGLFVLDPDSQHTEDEGAEGGGEEPAPVVADGEEGGGDLDAEQDAWHRGGGEGREGREAKARQSPGSWHASHIPPRAPRPRCGSRASSAKRAAGPRLSAPGREQEGSAGT